VRDSCRSGARREAPADGVKQILSLTRLITRRRSSSTSRTCECAQGSLAFRTRVKQLFGATLILASLLACTRAVTPGSGLNLCNDTTEPVTAYVAFSAARKSEGVAVSRFHLAAAQCVRAVRAPLRDERYFVRAELLSSYRVFDGSAEFCVARPRLVSLAWISGLPITLLHAEERRYCGRTVAGVESEWTGFAQLPREGRTTMRIGITSKGLRAD